MVLLKWASLAVFAACAVLIFLHPGWAGYAIGVHPYPAGTPWTYQLWSGFVPSLAIASLLSGVAAHLRMMHCHVHGCWRLGRFEMAGGQFKVCNRHSHHPKKITRQYVLATHEEHTRCAGPSSS